MKPDTKVEQDRQAIHAAQQLGWGATLAEYVRLSGPGWLQSAITLGGGSLAGSLYLGVIAGYELLWLQPLMMVLGVVMLSAIGYVALSTGRRPFEAINQDVNPVLGWAWAIATLMANLVWAMPQFSLGTAAIQQNLLGGASDAASKYAAVGALFVIAAVIVWFYDSGGVGVKVFDFLLKAMVAVIVLSFFGVVVAMSLSKQGLPWGQILAGFVPNFRLLLEPASQFREILAETVAEDYWRDKILASQRDRMVTAAATAVGINMTFLMPYSMLKRGWDRDFRGLATFDLATGLFVPFVLATSCVVIAAASQFHTRYDAVLVGEQAGEVTAPQGVRDAYAKNLDGVVKHLAGQTEHEDKSADQIKADVVSLADRKVAAMLVPRDANALANSLKDLTGETVAQYVFGVGVLGMAISTIIILMLINGFTVCEMLGQPSKGPLYYAGCIMPGITGALGFLFLWGDGNARFWLAVPTSVFGMVLLPIAYITFFLMMNSERLMGPHRLQGGKGLAANAVMLVALVAATIGASWSIWGRTQLVPGTSVQVRWVGIALVAVFVLAAIIVPLVRKPGPPAKPPA